MDQQQPERPFELGRRDRICRALGTEGTAGLVGWRGGLLKMMGDGG